MTDYTERLDKIGDKWRWMAGMVDTLGNRVLDMHKEYQDDEFLGHIPLIFDMEAECYVVMPEDATPDLTDPATQGCLEAQVREIFPHLEIYKEKDTHWWRVNIGIHRAYSEETREECILTALEHCDYPA